MINTVEHNITVELGAAISLAPDIKIKQNDTNSHKFVFRVTDNYAAYDLTGLTARAYFKKSDGNVVFQDCTIDSAANGMLSALLTTQCLTFAGFVSCELTIYGSAGELLTSASFNFRVLDLDRDDAAIASTSEFTSLTTLIVTAGQHETRIDAFEAVNGVVKGNGAGTFAAANATDLPITDTGNYFITDNAGAALQEVGAQLADIPNQTYITEKATKAEVQAVASGSPKGVYATVPLLTAAYPTGNTNVYLVTGNVAEAASLDVTAPCTASGNVTVTLNGVAVNVAVLTSDTAIQVATKIRAATFAGWTTGGTAGTTTVTFACNTTGAKTDAVFAVASTGVTGTMTTTTQGVDGDGKWYWWNGSSWAAGGTYQATKIPDGGITSNLIADSNVTPLKLSFGKTGKNLFNKDTVTIGYYINQASGLLVASASYNASDFIKVLPSTAYTRSEDGRIAYFDINKAYISGQSYAGATQTTPSNCYYVRYSFGISPNSMQFEQGSTATAYEAYTEYLDISTILKNKSVLKQMLNDKIIDLSKADFVTTGKNLFDKSTITVGYYINYLSGLLVINASYSSSDFIAILPSTVYTRNYAQHIAFYDINNVFISGNNNYSISPTQFTTPSNCYFIRLSVDISYINALQVEIGSSYTGYESYRYRFVKEGSSALFTPTINLPPTIPALVGKEINIYFDNLIDDKSSKYDFDVTCTIGKQSNNRWTCIPVSEGTFSIVINIYKEFNLVGSVTSSIIVKAITVGNAVAKIVNPIGDSTTAQAIYTQELVNLFNTDVMDLTLIGTKGTGANKHEGIAGWTINQFYTDVTSPFVFGGVFDYGQYITANSLSVPDVVTIHLGINDTFGYTDDASVYAAIPIALTKLQAMADNITAYNANIKVAIMVTIPPSKDQDAFGAFYQNGQTQWRYKKNNNLWVKALINQFKGKEANRIYLIPVNINLDTENNMSTVTEAINSRNSATVVRQFNGVHPADIGYYQMADVIYYWIKGFEV